MTLMVMAGALVVILIVGVVGVKGTVKRQELTAAKDQRKIAVAALRRIANGAGAPNIEAQIALDEIEQKEIS